jgi:N-acetylglucosaminyldiphosphoundecaprenol N-acetyl-beta-D-mannosaminyltransferase
MTTRFNTFDVLGLPIAAVSPEKASRIIHEWARDERGRFVCLRDVHGVMRAQQSDELFRVHLASDMLCPDGMPLVFIGKLRRQAVSQTCGANLLDRMMRDSIQSGLKHYFYGGTDGVAGEMVVALRQQYPGIKIVGHGTPPFRPLTDDEIEILAEEISELQADVVWIGLSTPKQEYLMHRLKDRSSATFLGIGAVYDFVTGRVSRAPRWMQRVGLEWLYRLASEPKRLWYRYLILAPLFVWKNLTLSSGPVARRKSGSPQP